VAAALPLFGAFVVGLGARRWLQRHIALLFRMQLAGGIGVLSVLAGWSFGTAWALICQMLMSYFQRTGRIEQPSD